MISFNSNFLKWPRNSILLLSQFSFLLEDLFPDNENEELCTVLTRSFIFIVKDFRVSNKTDRMQKSFQAKWGWACPWRQKGPVPMSWVGWGNLVDLKSHSFGPKYLLSSRNIFPAFERFRVQGIMVVRLYCLTESHFSLSKYSNLAGLAGVGARKLFYQPPHSHESDVDGVDTHF